MKAPTPKKENIEEGNYIATLCKIVYLGTVEGEYQGKETSAYKINLSWELPTELKVWKEGEDAKPVLISKMYTLSMGKKSSLRPVVEGILGGLTDAEAADLDIDSLLGKSCLLNVTYGVSETGKEKQNIVASKLMKGMEAPSPINKQVILSYDNWNQDVYDSLPQFMRDEMAKTAEFKNLALLEEISLDDIVESTQ